MSSRLFLNCILSDIGELSFYSGKDKSTVEEIVIPVTGRTVIFTSGAENPHRVSSVVSGTRFVLAFWFTTDEKKQMEIYLDGKAHRHFLAGSKNN